MQQLIFAKPPIPGKVKTRLAAFTGNQFATDLYRAMLEDVLSAFCFPSVNIPLSLYLTEEDNTGYFANRFPELPIYLQSGSDLGARMGKAFLESFARWPGQPILLTGSDIPSYSPDLARQAAVLLNEADCVLIPTRDGGYCTIGFRDPGLPDPEFLALFQNIRWSTGEVLQAQLQRLEARNLSVRLLDPLDDLDDASDMYRIRETLSSQKLGVLTSQQLGELPEVALLIPVFNEVENLEFVLEPIQQLHLFQHIVCADNGSNDGSPRKARALGALVSHCERRGYGSTCLAGMELLQEYPDWQILVFMDGDGSDDPEDLWEVLGPVLSGEADLCLGARLQGALLPHQKFGNWLATFLIRLLYGYSFRDLGPFRAIRRKSLQDLEMDDPDFGWTVQMQIRAVQRGLRIREVAVTSRKRHAGRSKVSATLKGSFLAGWIILRTVFREFLLNKKDSRV